MRTVRYRTENEAVHGIAGAAGRIYTPVVWIDSPVRLRKVPNGDVERYAATLAQDPKTVRRAARDILKAGKRLGITKGAKVFLREASRIGDTASTKGDMVATSHPQFRVRNVPTTEGL